MKTDKSSSRRSLVKRMIRMRRRGWVYTTGIYQNADGCLCADRRRMTRTERRVVGLSA